MSSPVATSVSPTLNELLRLLKLLETTFPIERFELDVRPAAHWYEVEHEIAYQREPSSAPLEIGSARITTFPIDRDANRASFRVGELDVHQSAVKTLAAGWFEPDAS